MKKGLIVFWTLLSLFSLKSQIRHTKGIHTFSAGLWVSTQEQGNTLKASYAYFLNRKQFIEIQASWENLQINRQREREYFEAVDTPGASQDELVLSTYTQKKLFNLKGYYLAILYGHLLLDVHDKIYIHGQAGIKSGYESIQTDSSNAKLVGGLAFGPEIQIYLSSNVGISLMSRGNYLPGADQDFRLFTGGSIILGF